MLARLSLRARLVLGVVALAAVGLAAADVATYASLRSFLLHRIDQALESEHGAFEHGPFGGKFDNGRGPGPGPGAAPGEFVQIRSPSGRVLYENFGNMLFGEQSGQSPPRRSLLSRSHTRRVRSPPALARRRPSGL